ncbi:ATP-binding protein [Chitiniphilus purpureus]|uniref:histidine kinase n=1 Tax=Chitiniphilus purpureus TaxID=2981137 RepID=A0ABY6DI97_9NEIS|nr:ATP-binding protein [Chitiniphilus sp. CD1]UXY14074.1 ATP-binding protein [Chitiniphilus sp. CD1]
MTEPDKSASSLFRRVLRNMALRIGLVALAVTALSYYYSYWRFQEEALAHLGKYIAARSQLESDPFLQAETNTRRLRDEFVRRFALAAQTDPAPEFHRLLQQERDGMWRIRLEQDDFEHQATVALLPSVKLTPDFMREVMVAFHLTSQYGPAFRSRYYDTFIDLNVSDGSIMYLPDLNYARNGSVADFAMNLETELGATPQRNPERKTFWTGIYFDKQAVQWMVSVVTPIDYMGRFIGGAGQDVLLDQLIERTNSVSIPGTYNFIIARNGDLIAHPGRSHQIRDVSGPYNLTQVNDQPLRDLYQAALAASPKQPFVESLDGRSWLGVAEIKGANWLFVSVYPKRLLKEKAAVAASMVLLLGMVALLLELGVMTWTLNHDVSQPLQRLKGAIRALAEGRRSADLDKHRKDELGELARTFDSMAVTIEEHRHNLEGLVETRTQELGVRNLELEAANLRLLQLNEEKNELLTIAAHDLKNPVASIQGMARMIGEKLPEWPAERVEERLQGIVKLSDRMQRILGNLLDINALETGQYQLRAAELQLDPLCSDLVAHWQAQLSEKQQCCICMPSGLAVRADREALWQVLDNLLSNASKYAPHQTAIRIEALTIGERVQIRVSDQGPGIAPHEMQRLFRKFSRLSAVPTGGEHTTGLGLSIVKRLIEAMDGRVGCESVLGHGATFYVELPAAKPA